MATRKRFTDDELFKLADEAQERWGTVSALQQAAGGGSAARFKKIIAEWEQRRHQGERSPSSRGEDPESSRQNRSGRVGRGARQRFGRSSRRRCRRPRGHELARWLRPR